MRLGIAFCPENVGAGGRPHGRWQIQSASAIPCVKRTSVMIGSSDVHQQLPQQLPSASEIPCAKRTIMVRVIVGVHKQLPQQLPSASEIPCAKRTILGRVIVGGQVF